MRIKILLTAFLMCACTQPEKAQRVLSDQGYTDIRMTGYKGFSCGKDDYYADGFVAKSPSGKNVSGAVCAGALFKGATIRFD